MALGLGLGLQFRRNNVGGLDPATQALLTQADADGYTPASGDTLTALDTYIKGLKSDGIWDKLDILYVFATNGDSDFATYNVLNPSAFQATKVNSPTFTSLEGFAGDGSSAYLDTGWSPDSNGFNYTLNSASFGYYVRDSRDGNTRIGSRVAFGNAMAYDFDSSNIRINTDTTFSPGDAFLAGHYIFNRTDSLTVNRYINGSINGSGADTSTSIPNFDFYVLALNNAGSPLVYSTNQLSIAFAGADISSESGDFYNLTQAYMTALGTEV